MSVLQMFGNWTFGTLVFTVMVITVTLKVNDIQSYALTTKEPVFFSHGISYYLKNCIPPSYNNILSVIFSCKYVYFSYMVTV